MCMAKISEADIISRERAQQIGRSIEKWRLTHAKSQADLQRIAKVSQGQISRILSGQFTGAGPALRRLCSAAGVNLDADTANGARERTQQKLQEELERCWDGSSEHAATLTELLRVAKRLRK